MNIIRAIGLSGIADFKKSVLKIGPGVTYVYGKNMLMGGTGNAAGKSLLGSTVAGIFYDTPIVGTKKDKAKTGVRFIEFEREGKKVQIQQSHVGRSERFKIYVDGEERKGRTPSMTKELIPKFWTVSEDEYRTYGHLDANVPHKLVRGSTLERKAFFTSFFQLDRLDAEKKVLSAHSNELKKIRARFSELDTTFRAVKADMLTKDQRIELEAQVEQLEDRLKALRSRGDEAQRIKSLLDFERFSKNQLEELEAACDIDSLDEDVVDQVRKRIRRARRLSESMDEWKIYKAALVQYQEATADLDMTLDLDELARRSAKFVEATTELKLYEKLVSPDLLYKPALKQMRQSAQKPDVSRAEMAKMEVRLDQMVNHSRKFKGGVCGECGQPVKAHDPDKIDELKTQLELLEMEWQQWDRYVELKAKYDKEMEDYGPKAEARERAERIQNKYREDHALYKKRQRIAKPEPVEKPEKPEDVVALNRVLGVFEWGLQNLQTIKDLRALTDEQRAIKFDADKLEAAQDKMSKAKTKLEVHNTVKARASTMRKRLQEFSAELADEEALLFALEAYDDKAMKKMAVEAISEKMMATINKMSAIVFNDFRFEFVWDTEIRLLVHRGNRPPTDVRTLSGAESKLFTLMLVFSLLMFVPTKKRLSLLILDEPCANFGQGMIERFHALLPHMLVLIPSILVLTPKDYERYQGAAEYTVFRDAGGAQIKKGHPSAL